VPVKSIEQQSMLCVHRLREGLKADRTACINRLRGLLGEFGLVFAQSPAVLQAVLADVLEDAGNEMNTLARLAMQRLHDQWREIDAHIAWCDERIAAVRRLGRPGAAPALLGRQEQPGRHHQTR
jgi:transposase